MVAAGQAGPGSHTTLRAEPGDDPRQEVRPRLHRHLHALQLVAAGLITALLVEVSRLRRTVGVELPPHDER